MIIWQSDDQEKRMLYEALTRHNYFPNQREGVGELPPCFDTRQFTPEVVEELNLLEESGERRKMGYDLVEYRATRYNNVPRVLGLVHPKAYALLAKCIHDNWGELKSVSENSKSIIKPKLHEDGRLLVMNYEDPTEKVTRGHIIGFGKRFRVHADIANCFNSVYSHSIPWAVIGIAEAKKSENRSNELWFNKLDLFQRKSKRGETQGISIGSASSSIIVELILGNVDRRLSEQGYEHYRYVDDYTCYCKTDEEAQRFIRDLGDFLGEYKLTLNLKKTHIDQLPAPSEESWVLELKGALPSRLSHEGEDAKALSTAEAVTFLNRAISVNQSTPDGSVLKYAFLSVKQHLDSGAVLACLDLLLNLAWHYPILIPLIDGYFELYKNSPSFYEEQLNELIIENALHKRTDGMTWPLYIMLKHGMSCNDEASMSVINSADCSAMTLLLEMGVTRDEIIRFGNKIAESDLYDKDSYWILLYQLYFKGMIEDPYKDGVFNRLKDRKVNFIPGDSITDAEKRCDEIKAQLEAESFKHIFGPVEGQQPEVEF